MKRVLKENQELADEIADKITEKMNADRDSRKPAGNPFLPGRESKVVAEDEDMDIAAEPEASDNAEDLFGDDFAL